MQDALDKIMGSQDRTTIVIAHRLSTVRNADRILVLENGGIREDGSHDELVKIGGTYSRMWAVQTGQNN